MHINNNSIRWGRCNMCPLRSLWCCSVLALGSSGGTTMVLGSSLMLICTVPLSQTAVRCYYVLPTSSLFYNKVITTKQTHGYSLFLSWVCVGGVFLLLIHSFYQHEIDSRNIKRCGQCTAWSCSTTLSMMSWSQSNPSESSLVSSSLSSLLIGNLWRSESCRRYPLYYHRVCLCVFREVALTVRNSFPTHPLLAE